MLMTSQESLGNMGYFIQSTGSSPGRLPGGGVNKLGPEQELIRRRGQVGWEGKSVPGTLGVHRSRGESDRNMEWGKPYPPRLSGPSLPLPHSRSAPMLIHGLEQRLLNASFDTYSFTLQSETIQALAFNLNCSFAGLSLSSDALEWAPQVRGGREMESGPCPHPRNPPGV